MMKDRYPADAWEFFPVNALLTHEQSVFFYIRTGLEVPDHQIAWALALGNGMYAEYSSSNRRKRTPTGSVSGGTPEGRRLPLHRQAARRLPPQMGRKSK
jgi:hypothetical protein